jgi:hypothetical protein
MILLKELTEEVKMLTEEKDGKKNFFIEGIFLQSEIENRNHRIYPKAILAREVSRYVKEFVDKNRAYGELGHPDTPNINPERISHRIVKLQEDGNNFYGKAMIHDTPYGNIVKGIMSGGGALGVSSRGMGSLKALKSEGTTMVQDDYFLATAGDVVVDPSAPDAMVQGIMENRQWCWDNGIIKEADIAQIKKEILGASKKQLEEITLRNFEKFINLL